ncbi:MAG: transposase [Desulfomicrobium sp.]|nr:transposase [Desulfomicrobium sp.]
MLFQNEFLHPLGATGVRRAVRQIFEVTEVLSKDGVFMMISEVRVCVLWTNLEFDAGQALTLYRNRSTSEQHHGAFKTEMAMERPPSGKFCVNATFLRLGMLAYNMLRVASVDLVVARMQGLKKANRRRTKTVMRSMMSICARITHYARKVILHVSCPKA